MDNLQKPDEPSTDDTQNAESEISRRGALALGGLLGAGGLFGLSGGAVGTAAAATAASYDSLTVADIITMEAKSGYNGDRLTFRDANASLDFLHMDRADETVIVTTDAWFRGGSLNDIGALDNSAITGQQRLVSLVGDNLSIDSGGNLTAAGPTTHDIDDYGADPTGTTPSDQALMDAANAANPGDRIEMTNGDYLFDEYHTFTEPYTIDAAGSTLECTQYNGNKSTVSQDDLYDSEEAVFLFKGSVGASTGITGAVTKHEDQVSVADASIFSVGDDVLIKDPNKGHLSRTYEPTRAVVRDIDGSTLHLHTPAKYDYDTNNAVYKVDAVVGPRVENAHFTGDAGCHVSFWNTRDARAENCQSDGYRQHAYQVIDGLDATLVDCRARDPLNLHGSHGECFRVAGSSDISIVRPVVEGCRRGIDLRSGCKTLRVEEPKIRGATLHCISYHNSSDATVRGNVEVRGGLLSARITDPTLSSSPEEYQGGVAFSGSSAEGHHKFEGVDMVCRSAIMSSSPNNVFVSNCTLRTAEGSSGTYLLNIEGNDVAFENVTIEHTAGTRDIAVHVTGSNVRLSGSVRGTFADDFVVVEGGASSVDSSLDISGGTDAGHHAYKLKQCSDVNIHDSHIDVAGRAVLFSGSGTTISGVSVDNNRIGANSGSGYGAISAWAGGTQTLENVHVVGNDLTGGSNHDIQFYDTAISGLWVKNNVCGVIDFGSSSTTDVFQRDNRTGQ
ncbi:hypothetical protein [Haloarchaeobius sp. DFWS5]|uniref:hypothetical protein n=1 Tax=Haloarchaeobius sp. DFWS5 TaxID=3446114 RepID=UPI003EBBB1D3